MSKSTKINYFHPQAFLLYKDLNNPGSGLKRAGLAPKRENASVYRISGKYEPSGVMSRIYNSKNASGNSIIKDNFFNLEPYKITALVPELRFYKVVGDKYIPFYLPISAISTDAASMDRESRLGASAVKNFSVEYKGTDPFTSPRYLDASLQLYVDNIQNLFADPPEPGYARLADLFTISIAKNGAVKKLPGGATITSGDLSRPIEVAATLGYSLINRDIFTREEMQEIMESNISLRMNVYSHSINIEQNGSATIDIKYTARINNAGRDKMFSAIDSPEDLLARADIKQMLKPDKQPSNSVKKSKRGESLERKKKKDTKKILEVRRIMEILDQRGQIYSVQATQQDILQYASFGYRNALIKQVSQALEPLSKAIEESKGDVSKLNESLGALKVPPRPPGDDFLNKSASFLKKLNDLDSSKREIYYVTFGDLVQAFMEKVKENLIKTKGLITAAGTEKGKKMLIEEDLGAFLEKSDDEKLKILKTIDESIKKLPTFKILLADFHYKHYTGTSDSNEKIRRLNIADIPISLFTYQKFMYDTVFNSDRNTYVIPQFLESCIRKGGLLDKALSEWSETSIAPNIISALPGFTSNTFSGPQLRKSVLQGGNLTTTQVPSPQKAFTASQVDDECDYYLIHQSPTPELTEDKSGRKQDDRRRGIYHFELGKNRGLFKSIGFSRIDVPFVQEQLMTNQVGMYDELKMVYNANIEMVGNNLFFPGSEIFVDPGSIGFGNPRNMNSAAYRLGLGGYYTVIGVSTKINNGVASTSLTCTHLAHPTDRVDKVQPDDPVAEAGKVGQQSQSADSQPQPAPDLGIEQGTGINSEYYTKLAALTDSDGNYIVDSDTAKNISNDFVTHPSERVSFPGLWKRQIENKTGIVVYHLENGRSIKIDPNNSQVTVIQNSKTLPKRR